MLFEAQGMAADLPSPADLELMRTLESWRVSPFKLTWLQETLMPTSSQTPLP